MDTLTDPRPASLLEPEEPVLQVISGDMLDLDPPGYSFDLGSHAYGEVDSWSWSSSTDWH